MTQATPQDAPRPAQAPAPVRFLPAPTGPNWGLVLVGVFFLLVAAGLAANQVAGFEIRQVTDAGPGLLVAAGLTLAVMGVVGMTLRRR